MLAPRDLVSECNERARTSAAGSSISLKSISVKTSASSVDNAALCSATSVSMSSGATFA
jgi:hypothetical protein